MLDHFAGVSKTIGKDKVNATHYEVGKKVRKTIEELGGTMPEELPIPKRV